MLFFIFFKIIFQRERPDKLFICSPLLVGLEFLLFELLKRSEEGKLFLEHIKLIISTFKSAFYFVNGLLF